MVFTAVLHARERFLADRTGGGVNCAGTATEREEM
jgi:hypothetical protein